MYATTTANHRPLPANLAEKVRPEPEGRAVGCFLPDVYLSMTPQEACELAQELFRAAGEALVLAARAELETAQQAAAELEVEKTTARNLESVTEMPAPDEDNELTELFNPITEEQFAELADREENLR